MVALVTPTRREVPAVSEADALSDTKINSSSAAVFPEFFWIPKSPDKLTKPGTFARNPFTNRAAWPSFTLSGALTDEPPTATVTTRLTMSAPVLLNATPTCSSPSVVRPAPNLRSAVPVACRANFWSPRITSATIALLTPARNVVPAVSKAAALSDTINNSSCAATEPFCRRSPKFPLISTKLAILALRPVMATVEAPWVTFSGAVAEAGPTDTVTLTSISAPVSLNETLALSAETEANPSPNSK